jgi:hypothetical protein
MGVRVGKERDLNLNSIDRFVKSSPHFVLEEHGHCEVPAGCGGAVLRWRNPEGPLSVSLQLWLSVAEYSVEIDGSEPPTSRPVLTPGRHVLVIAVNRDQESVQLLAAVTAEAQDGSTNSVTPSRESWRWTETKPRPSSAKDPSYPTEFWNRLKETELTTEQAENYQVRRLLDAGGVPMALDAGSGPVWIRVVLDIPRVG